MTCSSWFTSAFTDQRSRPWRMFELHALAEEALQQQRQVRQRLAELHDLGPQRLAAREGEQLAHEARGPVRVLLDLHEVLEGRIGRPVAREQQVRIADDRLQDVVEIVRDAAGELADRPASSAPGRIAARAGAARSCRARRGSTRLAVAASPSLDGVQPEAGRAAALAGERDVERRRLRPARGRGRERRLEARPVRPARRVEHGGRAAGARARRPAPKRRRKAGFERTMRPSPVERRDGERRGVEEAREPHLGGALALLRPRPRRAVEDERARGPGRPSGPKATRWWSRDRQALPAAPPRGRGRASRSAPRRACRPMRVSMRDDRGRHDVGELQPARARPWRGRGRASPRASRSCRRSAPSGRDREEAGRRVVEIVDRVLQLLEDVLVPLAVAA